MACRRVGNKPPIETAISKILHIVSFCVATILQHCLLSFILFALFSGLCVHNELYTNRLNTVKTPQQQVW